MNFCKQTWAVQTLKVLRNFFYNVSRRSSRKGVLYFFLLPVIFLYCVGWLSHLFHWMQFCPGFCWTVPRPPCCKYKGTYYNGFQSKAKKMWWLTGSARLLRQRRSRVRIRHRPQWSWCAAGSLCNIVKSQCGERELPLR